jgi:hypothetical protein
MKIRRWSAIGSSPEMGIVSGVDGILRGFVEGEVKK